MKIIVGLGNPGRKYERTRHNAGFMAVAELAGVLGTEIEQEKYSSLIVKARLDAEQVLLAKPQTYMNESGRAVASILRSGYASGPDLVVLHDELDLALGAIRIKIGGGHGGHNGLRSIIDWIGTADFVRVRIGIGRPAPGIDPADYVLSPFLAEERQSVPEIMRRAADAARTIVLEGPERAMNSINKR